MTTLNMRVWRDAQLSTEDPTTIRFVKEHGIGFVAPDRAFLNMRVDQEVKQARKELIAEMSRIKKVLATLQPDDSQKKIHEKMLEVYSFMVDYMKLANQPTGEYETYTFRVSSIADDFVRRYNTLKRELSK